MDAYFKLFDFLILVYGAYFLYLVLSVKWMGRPLITKHFMPTDLTLDNCKDPQAFTSFILPRMVVFGFLLIVYAATSLAGLLTHFVYYFIFFVVVIGLYALTVRQARARFW